MIRSVYTDPHVAGREFVYRRDSDGTYVCLVGRYTDDDALRIATEHYDDFDARPWWCKHSQVGGTHGGDPTLRVVALDYDMCVVTVEHAMTGEREDLRYVTHPVPSAAF